MARTGGAVPEVRASDGGAVIRLRVKARAGQTGVAGVHAGALRVAVNAAPEKGKANRAVMEVVAKALGLAPSSLRMLSGETSQDKQVWVPLDAVEAAKRLGAAV
ncbi:MAG: DUF167 domain-containing protein [Planctomycetia bacterium]|nr:DUF167 domain-containing protein [Planctomycetia bacterium]